MTVPGVLVAGLGISAAVPVGGHLALTAFSLTGQLVPGQPQPAPDPFATAADGDSPPLGGLTLGSTGLWPYTLLPAPGMILSAGLTLPAFGSTPAFGALPGAPTQSSALAAMLASNQPGGTPSALANGGIPVRAYQAYVAAAAKLAQTDPTCRLNWTVLAGLGRVESDHGRHAGSKVYGDGRVFPPIYGIRLDGSRAGTTAIRDSDGGRYDGDRQFDRAVGPMQFIPGTWAVYGQDGDGDGARDPQDIDDAALAAGAVLCAGPIDMSDPGSRRAAVFRYNHSESYVDTVLALADAYAAGSAVTVPSAAGLPPVVNPTPPPATVAPATSPSTTGPTKAPPTTTTTTRPTTHPTRPTSTPPRTTTTTRPTSTPTTATTQPTTSTTTTEPTTTTTPPATTTTTTTIPTTTTTTTTPGQATPEASPGGANTPSAAATGTTAP